MPSTELTHLMSGRLWKGMRGTTFLLHSGTNRDVTNESFLCTLMAKMTGVMVDCSCVLDKALLHVFTFLPYDLFPTFASKRSVLHNVCHVQGAHATCC